MRHLQVTRNILTAAVPVAKSRCFLDTTISFSAPPCVQSPLFPSPLLLVKHDAPSFCWWSLPFILPPLPPNPCTFPRRLPPFFLPMHRLLPHDVPPSVLWRVLLPAVMYMLGGGTEGEGRVRECTPWPTAIGQYDGTCLFFLAFAFLCTHS